MMIRTAILGLTHDHAWDHLPDLVASEDVELVGAAEPRTDVREKFEREFGKPAHTDFASVLDDTSLETVWIFSDNRTGAELAIEALRRNLHVVIEKPMADCLGRADAMVAAARQNDKQLIVNWPFAWWPQLQHALQLASDGAIGDLWQVRYRAAHAGPRELGCSDAFCDWLFDPALTGKGGALIDYCCYGSLLAAIAMGLPSRVTSVAGRLTKQDICVDDNAVVVMEYARGMAVAEGSWSQVGKISSYLTMFYGAEGTLLVEPRDGGRLLLANDEDPSGKEVSLPAPDARLRSATAHFVSCIKDHQPIAPLCDPWHARNAQEVLEAAVRSVEQQQSVSLPLSG